MIAENTNMIGFGVVVEKFSYLFVFHEIGFGKYRIFRPKRRSFFTWKWPKIEARASCKGASLIRATAIAVALIRDTPLQEARASILGHF